MYVCISPFHFIIMTNSDYILRKFRKQLILQMIYGQTFNVSAVEVPTTGATDVTKPIDNKPKPASGINVLFSFLAILIRLLVTEPIHGILVVVLCKGDEYGVDESYKLYVNSKGNPNYAHIEVDVTDSFIAATVYGALHVL
ncbi:hypothetical protein Hanom_Chr16g01471471 [Helianthus anomalus]